MLYEHGPVTPEDRLVTQISRWDRLKDPLGVMNGFVKHAAELAGAHLLLAGPSSEAVADDPEGAGVFADVREAWRNLPEAVRRRVHLVSLPMDDIDENGDRQRAVAAREHRRAEEPRRGLRADRGRGDVEAATRRGQPNWWNSRPDRPRQVRSAGHRSAGPARVRCRPCRDCFPTRTARTESASRRRQACSSTSSGPNISGATSRLSGGCFQLARERSRAVTRKRSRCDLAGLGRGDKAFALTGK